MAREMMYPFVCAGHHDGLEVVGLDATIYEALAQGWRKTTHRLWSYDGSEVWICPACVEKLVKMLTMERAKTLAEAAREQNWLDYQHAQAHYDDLFHSLGRVPYGP